MRYSKPVFLLVCFFIVAFSVYQIVSLFHIVSTTGLLKVSSNDKNSTLSVSQIDHQASFIGTGNAKIRLKPGSYQVSANDNGYQTVATIQIQKNKSAPVNLSLPAAAMSKSSGDLLSKLPFLGSSAEFEIVGVVGAQGNVTGPLIVIASSSDQTKQDALKWIQDQGFKPEDYLINYQTIKIQNYHYTGGLP